MVKSKVLFLLHLPPPVHGSAVVGKYIKESRVINQNFEAYYQNLLASQSLEETGMFKFRKLYNNVVLFFKLLKFLLTNKVELCYLAITARGLAFYRDVALIVLLRLFRVKLVYHMHNKGVSKNSDSWLNRKLYKYVFRDADVILLSKHLYHDIEAYVPPSRTFVCANGIPSVSKKIKKQPKDSRKPNILFVSNLIETKGVFVLLEALASIKNKGIQFSGSFVGSVGDITEKSFKEKVKELGLQDDVRYLGRKFGKEKEVLFESASIFAFPTFYENETFGLVNLEAMQYGLPVISTYEGGIPDIIDDGYTGFLVPQNDVDSLEEKLTALILNPELCEKFGFAGYERFHKYFTLDIFETRIVSILNRVLAQHSHAGHTS